MNKLAIGFSILATLCCVACTDDDEMWPEELTRGRAVFALQGGGNLSIAAEIEIFPQGESVAVAQLSAVAGDETLEVDLPPGSYSAELGEFTLFADGEPLPAEDVTFLAFEPDPLAIELLSRTEVTLKFALGTENLDLSFEPVPPVLRTIVSDCYPGCDAGQACANVNGAGPACFDTCSAASTCAAAGTTCAIPSESESELGAGVGVCLPNG
jgi:hypothetical protein